MEFHCLKSDDCIEYEADVYKRHASMTSSVTEIGQPVVVCISYVTNLLLVLIPQWIKTAHEFGLVSMRCGYARVRGYTSVAARTQAS